MGTISADTYRRLVALNVAARFSNGVYGAIRFQKITYIAQRPDDVRKAFSYRRHHYGQFSDELTDVREQLAAMGYVSVTPLDTASVATLSLSPGHEIQIPTGGNRYAVPDTDIRLHYKQLLRVIDQPMNDALDEAISEYGYLTQKDLIDRCYEFPGFADLAEGETIWESDIPDRIEVPLEDEECEDLELTLNPAFVTGLTKISDVLEHGAIDWGKVREVELPVPAESA